MFSYAPQIIPHQLFLALPLIHTGHRHQDNYEYKPKMFLEVKYIKSYLSKERNCCVVHRLKNWHPNPWCQGALVCPE